MQRIPDKQLPCLDSSVGDDANDDADESYRPWAGWKHLQPALQRIQTNDYFVWILSWVDEADTGDEAANDDAASCDDDDDDDAVLWWWHCESGDDEDADADSDAGAFADKDAGYDDDDDDDDKDDDAATDAGPPSCYFPHLPSSLHSVRSFFPSFRSPPWHPSSHKQLFISLSRLVRKVFFAFSCNQQVCRKIVVFY